MLAVVVRFSRYTYQPTTEAPKESSLLPGVASWLKGP